MKEWRGWTLIDARGDLVVDASMWKEPFTWVRKKDAEECKDEGMKVVRCVLKVEKQKK